MSNYKKQILSGFLYTSLGLILSKILTYGWRIVASGVGVEEYGIMSIVLVIIGFVIPLSALGLSSAVERYVSYFIGKNDRVGVKSTIINSIKYSLITSIIIAILLFLSSGYISESIFKILELKPILILFSICMPLLVIDNLLLPLFRVYNQLKYTVIIKNILESFLKLILTFIFVYLGYGLFGIVFAYLFSICISAILVFYYSKKHCFNFMDKSINTKNNISELLKYSLPLIFGSFAALILSSTDILMVGYFKGAAQTGIYNVAYPTANLLIIVSSALLAVFLPIITKMFAKKDFDGIKNAYIFVTKWIFILTFFMFLILFTYSDNIILLFFGKEYVAGSFVLKILASYVLLNSILTASVQILQMYKKTKIIMNILIMSAFLNFMLNYYLIPIYNINGAALATLISATLALILYQYFATKYSKMFPFSKEMLFSAICNIILFYGVIEIFTYLFDSISILIGILMIFTMGIAYTYVLYLFKIITLNEFRNILDMLRVKD